MKKELYTVIIYLEAKPDKVDELTKVLIGAVKMNRKIDGCIDYRLHQSLDHPTQFVFYENWRDKETHLFHAKEPEVQELMAKINPLLAKPFQVVFGKELAAAS